MRATNAEAAAYVLRFSTGEAASVSGSGLIGRKPQAQPGEYVDQLVVVSDSSRTVSKTHLEFGEELGQLWICDRYSGNGSVIREPGKTARRCEPGRRYIVTRGTHVDIGDQSFLIV